MLNIYHLLVELESSTFYLSAELHISEAYDPGGILCSCPPHPFILAKIWKKGGGVFFSKKEKNVQLLRGMRVVLQPENIFSACQFL